jgi:hypothetical protein
VTPKIAMLVASDRTQYAMRIWARAQGFDLTRTHGGRQITEDMFDFHVTLLATANPISAPATDHRIAALEVEAVGFETLGKDADTPVLSLEAGEALQLAREFFVEVYGAEPTFEDFKPHISLSYNWRGVPALSDLELPDFPLIFDRLIVTEFEAEQKALILPRRIVPGAHAVYR